MTDYSIYVIEYARVEKHPLGNLLYGAWNRGWVEVPYSFYLVESAAEAILVDTGFTTETVTGLAMAQKYGISICEAPERILVRLGFEPQEIKTALLTHAHFDHMGRLEAFQRAAFVLQERELSKSVWALSLPNRLKWLATALTDEDVQRAVDLANNGRLRLVDGVVENILPGITLRPAHDTHSYGSQYVVIDTRSTGRWILAGDVAMTSLNLTGDTIPGQYVPVGFAVGSQVRCIEVMEEMMCLVDEDASRIVPLHDPTLHERFPSRDLGSGLNIIQICSCEGIRSRLDRPVATFLP